MHIQLSRSPNRTIRVFFIHLIVNEFFICVSSFLVQCTLNACVNAVAATASVRIADDWYCLRFFVHIQFYSLPADRRISRIFHLAQDFFFGAFFSLVFFFIQNFDFTNLVFWNLFLHTSFPKKNHHGKVIIELICELFEWEYFSVL